MSQLRSIITPKIGERIAKTGVAIALSVMTARLLNLGSPQFAGIVSVLAVQPSVYRSLRQGLQQFISATVGAVAGIVALYLLGSSPVVFGIVALVLMGLHARWQWTNSLLVAVVIAINTIGAHGNTDWGGGLNQLALVFIGLGYGNLINLIIKPTHGARSASLLLNCERDVFRLLHRIHKDLYGGTVTPYVIFKKRINAVRATLEEGKRIAGYVYEDQKYRDPPEKSILHSFHTLESMVERIRDMNKTMQALHGYEQRSELVRLADITLRMQHRILWGRHTHVHFVDGSYQRVERCFIQEPLPTTHAGFIEQAMEYHLYKYLREYYEKLKDLCGDRIINSELKHIG